MVKDIGILGGGISGLYCARFLGGDVEVLEADSRPGGLARTFGGKGFLSDIGGHILFSKDKEALAHLVAPLRDNCRIGFRQNKILYNGIHVKYPFENGIDALPAEDRVDILQTFIENPHTETPNNLHEWMYHVFGDGLTDRYMLPYNEKIWKTSSKEMSLEWVERIPRPPLRDLLRTAVGISTEGYTHQLNFHYPKEGGFEALPQTLARELGPKVVTGFRARSLRKSEAGWVVTGESGETREYRQLIATIPVTALLGALDDVPSEVLHAAENLRFNSLRVVLFGLATQDTPPYTALYVPDSRSVYHRVCFNQIFSPCMAPIGQSSVSCEITVRPGSPLDQETDEALIERTAADLVRDGVIRRDDVVHAEVHREKLAYVVYDLGYSERVRIVRSYIEGLGLHLAGRFAEYQYVNTDSCVRRALDLSRALRGGEIAPEAQLPATLPEGVIL